jgi:hypothetical protein
MDRPKPVRVTKCPSCGSRDVNAIWYGLPCGDPATEWPPNVSVGGCCVSLDAANRACNWCGHQWQTPAAARASKKHLAMLAMQQI